MTRRIRYVSGGGSGESGRDGEGRRTPYENSLRGDGSAGCEQSVRCEVENLGGQLWAPRDFAQLRAGRTPSKATRRAMLLSILRA